MFNQGFIFAVRRAEPMRWYYRSFQELFNQRFIFVARRAEPRRWYYRRFQKLFNQELYLQLGEQNQGDDTREGSRSCLIKDCLEESIQVLKKSTTQSLLKLEKELGLLGSVLDQIPRKPDHSCSSNHLIIFHKM